MSEEVEGYGVMTEDALAPLFYIQQHLKAPKNQYNKFGNFNYRSVEGILEAAKPLMNEVRCVLVFQDEIEVHGDRHYLKATAILKRITGEVVEQTTAYAREAESKSGMEVAQVSGSSSSYSRKYALNSLFGIDDSQDPDTQDNSKKTEKKPPAKKSAPPSTPPKKAAAGTWTFEKVIEGEGLPPKTVDLFLKERAEAAGVTVEEKKKEAMEKPKSFVNAFKKWVEAQKEGNKDE